MVKHLLGILESQQDYLLELLLLHTDFLTTNNPTATRITLISPTTRHLIHFGTETTIGTPSTQDDMFIRFSEQENINDYTIKQLTLQVHKDFKMVQKLWEL